MPQNLAPSDYYAENLKQQLLLDRLEVTARNRIGREINRYIREYAALYAEGRNSELPFLIFKHERNIIAILDANIKKTVPAFGKEVLRQIEVAVKQDTPSLWQRIADKWLLTRGLEQASNIAKTTSDDVQRVIIETLKETISVNEIAKQIRKVARFTPNRAEMIARTETHNAASFASIETARNQQQELGLQMVKKWVPVMDARTRDNHAAMASHPMIELDEKFNVGGAMMDRPGDPSGGASNVIRCRCTLVYRRKQIEIE